MSMTEVHTYMFRASLTYCYLISLNYHKIGHEAGFKDSFIYFK